MSPLAGTHADPESPVPQALTLGSSRPASRPFPRVPGTLPFSNLTFSLRHRGFGGPSDDQTEKPEGSSCHFCRQGSQGWKNAARALARFLSPHPFSTPPTPVHANEGQPLGKRASLAAQTIETKPSGGDLALSPRAVGCVVRAGICGPEEHRGLDSRSGWVVCEG